MANRKSSKLGDKYIQILKFLKERPEGVRAETLIKFLNLPTRTLYNRLSRLKELNLIENIYPIWRIAKNQASYQKVTKLLEDSKEVQGHKYSFTLKLIKKPDWWEKRDNKLIKIKEFHFKKVEWNKNPYQQLLGDDYLIQTFSNSIVFHSRKYYWANDPYDTFTEALEDVLEMLRFLEDKVKFKFYEHGVPQFSVRSQHLVKLRDSIANRCKKEKKGYEVVIDDKRRVWVDLSEPFGREAGHKNYAPEDLKRLQNRDKDVLVNDPSLPSDVDKRIESMVVVMEGVQQNQMAFAENMRSHIKAVQDLGAGVENQNKIFEEQSKTLEEMMKFLKEIRK